MPLCRGLLAGTVAGLTLLSASGLRADTITVGDVSVSGPAGARVFTYSAALSEAPNIIGPGQDSQVRPGDFFTVYDFGPVIAAVLPPAWGLSQSVTGLDASGTVVPDDPSKLNATLTYFGPIINTDLLVSILGTFSLTSNTPTVAVSLGHYTAEDTREFPGNDGIEDSISLLDVSPGGNNGRVLVPTDAFAVPTPASGLGGLALLGVLAYVKKRRIA